MVVGFVGDVDGGHKVDLDAAGGLIGSEGSFHAACLRSGFDEAEKLGAFFLGKERACGCAQEEKADHLADLADRESHNRFGCFVYLLLRIHFGGYGAGRKFGFLISPQSKEKGKGPSVALLKPFRDRLSGKNRKTCWREEMKGLQRAPARPLLQQEKNKVF